MGPRRTSPIPVGVKAPGGRQSCCEARRIPESSAQSRPAAKGFTEPRGAPRHPPGRSDPPRPVCVALGPVPQPRGPGRCQARPAAGRLRELVLPHTGLNPSLPRAIAQCRGRLSFPVTALPGCSPHSRPQDTCSRLLSFCFSSQPVPSPDNCKYLIVCCLSPLKKNLSCIRAEVLHIFMLLLFFNFQLSLSITQHVGGTLQVSAG